MKLYTSLLCSTKVSKPYKFNEKAVINDQYIHTFFFKPSTMFLQQQQSISDRFKIAAN